MKKIGEGEQRHGESSSAHPISSPSPLLAFLLSLAIHGLIAAGIALYINYAPAPDELAQLDLTSVDLSFAETPDEAAAAALASAPTMPQAKPPKPSEPDAPPPLETTQAVEPTMPAPDTTDLPSPDEPHEQLETPPAPIAAQQAPSAPAAAPRQAKVDAPPKPRRSIRPDYPRESRQRGEQGSVTLEIDVDAEGTVEGVRVARSSGFALLDDAAVRAARSARFTPAKTGREAVPSTARLTLEFRLK